MPKIIIRPQANEDIGQIWFYIASESGYERADAFDTKITEKLNELIRFPRSGKPRPELMAGLRSAVVGSYLIFYLPIKDGIEVVRIIYGGRDLNMIDFDSEN
jgi:toxin ParE1/3/4